MNRRRAFVGTLLGLLATAGIVGCGTGEYDARLQATLANVGRKAAIESQLAPNSMDVGGGTGVRLRLPLSFSANAKPVGPGDPRATIGGVAVPGLISGLERAIDDPAGKFSVSYVYFAAVPKEGKPQDALQNELRGAIAGVLPNAKWETAQLDKLAGGSVTFPVLVATGAQTFDATQNGGANEQHDGKVEIYLVPADKHWVLLGWRAPTAHAGKYKFFDAVRAAMSTVEGGGGGGAAGSAPVNP